MKQLIKDYFTFNKQERNGVIVLLAILAILLFLLKYPTIFIHPDRQTDFSQFEKAIAVFEKTKKQSESATGPEMIDQEEKNPGRYFVFDPNDLSVEGWMRLGLTKKQVQVIKNYQSKGGRFFKKADLKKMYSISEKQYLLLEPYIVISENVDNQIVVQDGESISGKDTMGRQDERIELNTADTNQLMELRGIGPFYAKEIIKYREKLGGYCNEQQLLALWKFDQSKLNLIADKISIDISSIRKININTCNVQELKHPYLKWSQVNAIVNYRTKHGMYNSVDEIKKTSTLDDRTFQLVSPYLTID